LENNLAACDAFLDFASQVPSHLSSLQSDGKLPAFGSLESAPIGPLVASAFKSKPKPLSETPPALKKSKGKAKAPQLPPSIAEMAPEDRPPIDPERWLPKRDRAAYKDELALKQKQKEAKERQKEKLTVQGSSSASNVVNPAASSGQAKTGTSSASAAKKVKGKGKKR
jgi:hypothetical protein